MTVSGLIGAAGAVADEPQPTVVVLDAQNTPADVAAVSIGPGQTGGSAPFQLRNDGPGPVELSAVTASIGAGTVAVKLANGSERVNLEPHVPVSFLLEVSGIDGAGVYTGYLSANAKGEGEGAKEARIPLTTVSVEKRTASPLELNGKIDAVTLPTTTVVTRTYTMQLKNVGASQVRAAVSASLLEGPGGPASEQPKLEVNWPNAGEPNILRANETASVSYTVNLPRDGAYSSSFQLVANDIAQPPISVSMTRTSEKVLELVDGDQGYSVDVFDTQAIVGVSVVNTINADVSDVIVQVPDFLGPSGPVAAEATFGTLPVKDPQTLPAGQVRDIKVTLNAPQAGDYSGTVRVVVGGVPADVASIKVTRKVEPTAVALTTGTTSFTTFVKDDKRFVPIVLTDQAGAIRPVCLTLATVHATTDDIPDGHEIKLASLDLGSIPEVAPADEKCETRWFKLQPRSPTSITAELTGVPAAGAYQITFSVTDGSRSAITSQATVNSRASGWFALLVVALGASCGLALSFVPLRRKKTKRGRYLDFVSAILVQNPDPLASDVIATLKDRLWARRVEVADDAEAVDDRIKQLVRQASLLPLYVLNLRLAKERGVLNLPPGMETARKALLDATMDEAGKTKTQSDLGNARRAIELAAQFEPSIDALEEVYDQALASGIASSKLIEVPAKLAEARKAIADVDAQAVRASLLAARKAFGVPLADALEAFAGEEPPQGMVPQTVADDLARARASAQQAAAVLRTTNDDPGAGFDAYKEAVVALTNAHARHLSALTTAGVNGLPADDPQVPLLSAAATAAARVLNATSGLVEKSALLKAAQVAYAAAVPGAHPENVGQQSALAGAPGVPPAIPPTQADAPPGSYVPTPDLSDRLGVGTEGALFVVTVAVAALLGWQAQWISNLVWGRPADYLTAFMWGLVGGTVSFTGVRPLLARLEGSAS